RIQSPLDSIDLKADLPARSIREGADFIETVSEEGDRFHGAYIKTNIMRPVDPPRPAPPAPAGRPPSPDRPCPSTSRRTSGPGQAWRACRGSRRARRPPP